MASISRFRSRTSISTPRFASELAAHTTHSRLWDRLNRGNKYRWLGNLRRGACPGRSNTLSASADTPVRHAIANLSSTRPKRNCRRRSGRANRVSRRASLAPIRSAKNARSSASTFLPSSNHKVADGALLFFRNLDKVTLERDPGNHCACMTFELSGARHDVLLIVADDIHYRVGA